jgi:integrase
VGIRNRALLSIGYDFLARRSELTALRNEDVEFDARGGLRGVIRRSKTDPYGRGRLVFGSERSAKLLRRWLRRKPKDIPWLFCAVNHDTCLDRSVCGRTVSEIVKRAVLRTRGARPREAEISGHSLRVGAAQDLLADGHDIGAIMRAGGWSNMSIAMRYLSLAEHNIWQSR